MQNSFQYNTLAICTFSTVSTFGECSELEPCPNVMSQIVSPKGKSNKMSKKWAKFMICSEVGVTCPYTNPNGLSEQHVGHQSNIRIICPP